MLSELPTETIGNSRVRALLKVSNYGNGDPI